MIFISNLLIKMNIVIPYKSFLHIISKECDNLLIFTVEENVKFSYNNGNFEK